MNLRVFLGALLAVVAGCGDKAPPPAPAPLPEVELFSDQLVTKAMESLKLSAVPEAPLSPTSTRQERAEYLLATEDARKCFAKLMLAPVPEPEQQRTLLSRDRTDEILSVSRVLGVQMADAIDRGDAESAKKALFIGFRYADLVGRYSVGDWVSSGAIADGLCQGIKSVAEQLDEKTASALRQAVEDLNAKAPDPGTSILQTIGRLKNWAITVGTAKSGVSVEQALMEVSPTTSGRPLPTPAIVNALRKRAANGMLSAAFRTNEANLTAARAEEFLNGARSGSTVALKVPQPTSNPLAALYLGVLRPNIEAAPRLADIREESLRTVALTVRIIAAGMPADLTTFGQDAISPVSGMRFEYKKSTDSFELVRPRSKA